MPQVNWRNLSDLYVQQTHLILLNKAMLFLFNANEAVARNGITGYVSNYRGTVVNNEQCFLSARFFRRKDSSGVI